MVQIISDKPSNLINWIAEVLEHLTNENSSVSRMVIISETDDTEDELGYQTIEFMNCNTNDIYRLGGVLQKEAIKHELIDELALDDESWEEYYEEFDNEDTDEDDDDGVIV